MVLKHLLIGIDGTIRQIKPIGGFISNKYKYSRVKKATIIVCSNGFGHYRRCARVAYQLVEKYNIFINFVCVEKPLLYCLDQDSKDGINSWKMNFYMKMHIQIY